MAVRRTRARRVAIAVSILVALAVVAVVVVFLAKRPDQHETEAASAAKVAMYDTEPDPGTNASCEFAPSISLAVFKAHYDCVARTCRIEEARLQVTHELFGGWSYRITSGGQLGTPSEGHTVTTDQDPSHLDPDDCH